jgi:hypothetical protein
MRRVSGAEGRESLLSAAHLQAGELSLDRYICESDAL